ncbi:BLUF domain-containing protein, partial [Devosia sp.]|uniref:BLUF domain-containing protein n=1 Tax=Devosia sp. TaxID=1871048 RepID=UPI002FC5FCBA
MLHRVIYASEAVGATGATTLSIAQILGVSERNNRRDHLTSCVMFHQGHILQAIEGGRADVDRLIRRLTLG